jgi:cobalt/nickel transport system permease protein
MHHLHIDRYAGIQSPVHAIDPRVKLTAAVLFVLVVVLTPEHWFVSYLCYSTILAIMIAVSRIPAGYILKRSLLVLPFAAAVSLFVPFTTPGRTLEAVPLFNNIFTITAEGLERFAALNLKALISFVTTFLLVATTRFGDLMWGASKIGAPAKLVLVISFMYRYLFILLDKAAHMMLARDLRSPRHSGAARLAASGNIVGALFVRSYVHATALYDAMLLRGYSGKPSRAADLHLQVPDILAGMGFIALSIAACLTGGLYNG